MKKSVFVLLALLSLLPLAQAIAQTPPVATPAANAVTAPGPDAATAQFLATLSGGGSQTPADLAPAPSFRSGCNFSSDCATGQLCCRLCGNIPEGGTCPGTCYTGRKCPIVQ
jgi:hypothetical protein